MFRRLIRKLQGVLGSQQLHDEISEEREFHISMLSADLRRRGVGERAAEGQARQKFGKALRLHESAFEARAGLLSEVTADILFAFRTLRKRPTKTITLLITLALSIGINVAVFTLVSTVLFAPLPFPEPSRLVVLHQISKGNVEGVSYPNFQDWQVRNKSFEGMAVYAADSSLISNGIRSRREFGAVVSADLFRLLQVTPIRGRLFTASEDAADSERTVVISDTLWDSLFGRREDVIGQFLRLDGARHRIIGIIPSPSAFPILKDAASYWITTAVDAHPTAWGGSARESRSYPRYDGVLARLRPGVSVEEAQAEMNIIAAHIAREHRKADTKEGSLVQPALDEVVGKVRPFFWILLGAVFCLLTVGLANATTLLLVDSSVRYPEFALRAALGAKPLRLLRQIVAETSVVAWAGGACGIFVAYWLTKLLIIVAPRETPRLTTVHLSYQVLIYALGVTLTAGLGFSFARAAVAWKQNLVSNLRQGAFQSAGPRRTSPGKLQTGVVLITAQVTLSMVMSCSAVMLTNSFWRILHAPRGFEAQNVLTASVELPAAKYVLGTRNVSLLYGQLTERVRRLPGVRSVGLTQSLPLSGRNNSTQVEIEGVAAPENASTALRFVDPDYFQTLRIPLLEGRFPGPRDQFGATPTVVVNEAFMRRFLDRRHALGARIRLGWGGDAPKQIVGVVGNILHDTLSTQTTPEAYVPVSQFPVTDMSLVIRTSNDPRTVIGVLPAAVSNLDPEISIEGIRMLDDYLLLSAAPQRFLMWLLLLLAAATLLLAGVGLYGSLSHVTIWRQREFAIRMVLGSSYWGVMRAVFTPGLSMLLTGGTVGLVLTVPAAYLLRAWLYQATALDLTSLGLGAATLASVGIVACWIPARRAIAVDPAKCLRDQ